MYSHLVQISEFKMNFHCNPEGLQLFLKVQLQQNLLALENSQDDNVASKQLYKSITSELIAVGIARYAVTAWQWAGVVLMSQQFAASAEDGGYKAKFLHSVIFHYYFFVCESLNMDYWANITFIFDWCHCSSDAMAPVKYDCDRIILQWVLTFTKSGTPQMEWLHKWSFSNPHLWFWFCWWCGKMSKK